MLRAICVVAAVTGVAASTELIFQGFDASAEPLGDPATEDVFVFGSDGGLDYTREAGDDTGPGAGQARFKYRVVQTETWGGYVARAAASTSREHSFRPTASSRAYVGTTTVRRPRRSSGRL